MMNKKIILLIASITGSAFADGGTSATAVSAAPAQPAPVVPVAAKTPTPAPTLVQAAPQPMLAASQSAISVPPTPASSASVSVDDQLKQVQGLIQQNKLGVNGLLDMLNTIQTTDPGKVQHLGELKQRAQQMQNNLAKFEGQLAESFATRLTMLQKMQASVGDFLAHIAKFKESLAKAQQQGAAQPAQVQKPAPQPAQALAAPALAPQQTSVVKQVQAASVQPAPAEKPAQVPAAPAPAPQPAAVAQQAPVAPVAVSTDKAAPVPTPASQPAPVVAAPAAQPAPAVQPAPVKK